MLRLLGSAALLLGRGFAISGGTELTASQYEEVQWVVSIGRSCGGALIAPTWVLTASHCVTDHNGWNENLVVVHHCRIRDLDCVDRPSHRVKVAKVLPHPCFFPRLNTGVCQNSHDSALLKLAKPIVVPEYASISTELVHGLEHAGFEGVAFGWGGIGKYHDHNRHRPVTSIPLKMVKIAYDSNRKCEKKWSDKGIKTGLDIKDEKVFCAGVGDGNGVCEGDSGGPLAARMKRADGSIYWVVYGTVSRATPDWKAMDTHNENSGPCNAPGRFGIFTNVKYYEAWMRETMANCDKLADPSSCTNGVCPKNEQCWTAAIKDDSVVRRTKALNKGTMTYVEKHVVEPKTIDNLDLKPVG